MAKSSTSFKPGESGNPGGRPKRVSELRERALDAFDAYVLKAWVDEVIPRERPVLKADGEVLRDREGDPIVIVDRGPEWKHAADQIANYGMGKPITIVEHGGRDGGKIELEVRFVKSPKPDKKP